MLHFKIPKKMETRRLDNSELKRLARVLQGVPSSLYSRDDAYQKATKKDIKELPRRLRQSIVSASDLCSAHKDLDSHLLNEIWGWMRHEFDSGLGKLFFPLILTQVLTPDQESKIRQLEPVLQMWRKDFKTELSAPPGCQPIDRGVKWAYEADQCPACILGRIGSDDKVLCALYAGMIGRFPTHKLVHGKVPLAELTVAKLDKPKSKRIRFVRYWIKASSKGETLLHEATELGIELKKLFRQWKDAQRTERVSLYEGRVSLDGTTARNSLEGTTARNSIASNPFRDHERSRTVVDPGYPRQSSRYSQDTQRPRTVIDPSDRQHPALHPLPQSGVGNTMPYAHRGSSRSHYTDSDPFGPRESSRPLLNPRPRDTATDYSTTSSNSTLYPSDSISHASSARVAPLRIDKRKDKGPASHGPTIIGYPPPPESTTSTIQSYDGPSTGAFNNFDPFLTQEERFKKYKELLAGPNPFADEEDEGSAWRRPPRQSMYHGYGNGGVEEDPFGDVDEEEEEPISPMTPQASSSKDGQRLSRASTHWDDMY